MQSLTIGPYSHASGTVALPGSKSISNRVLLLSALAHGTTNVRGLLAADDTQVMLNALHTLGVAMEQDGDQVTMHGSGGVFAVKHADLFMGNAGTAIRPLTAALALMGGSYTLHGVPRMHERPIGDLVDGLAMIGAQIMYTGTPGFPPLTILPSAIDVTRPIRVRGDVSSQFLTALLLALPLVARQSITIEVVGDLISKPYVAITLNLMQRYGVNVTNHDWRSFVIPANDGAYRSPGDVWIEGDASSASYFLAAGAIAGGPVRVTGVGRNSIQGDVAFVEALAQMGAAVAYGDDWIEVRQNGPLRGITINCLAIPDAAMTLAVAGLFAIGTTTLTGIASWRVKETDRIHAMATELRKVGAEVTSGDDFIRVTAPQTWQVARGGIDTYDDHRMAMCFSLTAFGTHAVQINNPECVGKTYPEYFNEFSTIVQ
ncbi:MAG: 3-phosphoshikimate 1-carboxyvinyltransferase [Chloroflexota bacterium]|jgi:3-phosphoshikimate 1-carboxyvinyltransferase